MVYAQFYQSSVVSPLHPEQRLIEVCGNDGVLILDGRLSRANQANKARAMCRHRGFKAFRLFTGELFTTSRPIGAITLV